MEARGWPIPYAAASARLNFSLTGKLHRNVSLGRREPTEEVGRPSVRARLLWVVC